MLNVVRTASASEVASVAAVGLKMAQVEGYRCPGFK
jgi:hypothetical protein